LLSYLNSCLLLYKSNFYYIVTSKEVNRFGESKDTSVLNETQAHEDIRETGGITLHILKPGTK